MEILLIREASASQVTDVKRWRRCLPVRKLTWPLLVGSTTVTVKDTDDIGKVAAEITSAGLLRNEAVAQIFVCTGRRLSGIFSGSRRLDGVINTRVAYGDDQ